MKKNPRHKRNRPKGNRNSASSSGLNMQSINPGTDREGPPEPKWKTVRFVWLCWERFWAFAGPLAAVFGFSFNPIPDIVIEPSVNLDPTQTYSTQILIANRGRVPVYELSFSCKIGVGGGSTYIKSLTIDSSLIEPAPALPASQSITRACAIAGNVEGNRKLDFTVQYHWPIIGKIDSKTAHFNVKRGPPGFFLLPDAGG